MAKIKFDKFNPSILIGYTFLGRVEISKIIDIDEVEPDNYQVTRKYLSGTLEKTTSFTKQELYDLYLGKKVDGDEIVAPKMKKGGNISGELSVNPSFKHKNIIARWLEDNKPESLKYKVAVKLLKGETDADEEFKLGENQYDRILRSLESITESKHEMAWRTKNYSTIQAEKWATDALKQYFVINHSKGGGTSRSQKQYNKEVDKYKFFIIDIANKKAVSGWEFKDDAQEALSDYDGDKNFKVVAEVTLSKMGIENPKEKFKQYADGGDVSSSFEYTIGGL